MPSDTPRAVSAAALAAVIALVGVASVVTSCSRPDGPAAGTSLQRGGGSPTASVQARRGDVAISFVDALTNVDSQPITLVDVRPGHVDPGLRFDDAVVDTTGGGTLVTWSGSAQQAADLARVHGYRPAPGLTVDPGATVATLQLRYTLTDDARYPYVAQDVRVEYRRDGETFVETLHQRVVVLRTPPPPPPSL